MSIRRSDRPVKLEWWLRGGTEFTKWAAAEMLSWPFEQEKDYGRSIYFRELSEHHAIYFCNDRKYTLKWYIQNNGQLVHNAARWLHCWLCDPETDEIVELKRAGCDVSIRRDNGDASFNLESVEQVRTVQKILIDRYDRP